MRSRSEFDKVDWIFVGAGTTGTLAGVSERLRQEFPESRLWPSSLLGRSLSAVRPERGTYLASERA